LMELLLEDMDCAVVMADSGPQALQLLDAELSQNRSFDIIVTDLQMPEMDGEELGKLIKADPRTNAIPLVMLTSVAMRGDGARLAENNFAAYLTKPIKSSLLYQCLQTVLGITRNGDDITPLVTRHTLSEQRRVGHILVVEDNLTNQRVAQKMLERLGHTCELANNGLEGLKKLEAGDFDLVLMDCQMPEMDGYQATRAIRAADTKVRNPQIPIIALTANAMQGDRDAALEAGMSDYLPKPFDVHLFEETLARWLKKIKVSPRDITILANQTAPASTIQGKHLATFSPAEVLNRMDDDLEMAILIIREGVIELERMLPLLETELANGDMTAAFRLAHTIKGMADSAGGVAMHDTSAKVCNAIKKDDLPQAATFIPKLHVQLSSLNEAASAWLEEQNNNNA
jgi:two-component system sensor histidine kinase/response regulator